MFLLANLWYSPSKPLEQSLWTTSGSGNQLRMVVVRSGSHFMRRGLIVIVLHCWFPVRRSAMKEYIAALSTILLVARLPNQWNLSLVSDSTFTARVHEVTTVAQFLPCACNMYLTITSRLQDKFFLANLLPQATGTKPVSYHWPPRRREVAGKCFAGKPSNAFHCSWCMWTKHSFIHTMTPQSMMDLELYICKVWQHVHVCMLRM